FDELDDGIAVVEGEADEFFLRLGGGGDGFIHVGEDAIFAERLADGVGATHGLGALGFFSASAFASGDSAAAAGAATAQSPHHFAHHILDEGLVHGLLPEGGETPPLLA